MIRSIGGRDEDLSIVSGFDRTMYDGFKNALERGQTNAWEQILQFVQRELIHAFGKNSAVVMQQLNWLPSAIYNLSAGNTNASAKVAREFGSFFKTVSWIFKPDKELKDHITGNEVRFNMFFKTLMNFYHYAIHHPDEKVVREIIRDFKSIAGDEFDVETSFEIPGFKDANQKTKKEMRNNVEREHLLMITQRRAALSLIAWLTFLYTMEKITEERYIFLIQQFDLHYEHFEELLSDIVYIRANEARDYMGIGFWDYMERESGVMYSPPSAYDWIIFGPALLLLRDPLPEFNPDAIIDDGQNAFLLDAVRVKLNVFKLRLDTFSAVLGWDKMFIQSNDTSRDEKMQAYFEERKEEALEMFHYIKTLNEEEENKQLAERPLDKDLIIKFKETLYDKWIAACLSYQLFRNKAAIEVVPEDKGLDYHGQNILLEHQKTMFVQGEQQNIYGSEDLGAVVGRGVDERFIYDVTKQAPRQKTENDQNFDEVTIGLDACIVTIRANENEPDAIILPSTFFYKSDLTKSPKYRRIELKDKSMQIGVYDNIPVYRLFAQGLQSKAIVASIGEGLSLSLWEDMQLYKKFLHIELRELTQDEINEEYLKNKEKWSVNADGIQLSEKQSKLRLAASLMLNMWSKGKFTITNSKGVTWCAFTAKASEKDTI